AALDQLVKVLARFGDIRHALRKFLHSHALSPQTLRARLHLVRVKQHFAQFEALLEIEQRRLDRRFEVDRLIRTRLKYAVTHKTRATRSAIKRDSNNSGAVVLHRRVNTNPHRQARAAKRHARARIDARVKPAHVDKGALGGNPFVADHAAELV